MLNYLAMTTKMLGYKLNYNLPVKKKKAFPEGKTLLITPLKLFDVCEIFDSTNHLASI